MEMTHRITALMAAIGLACVAAPVHAGIFTTATFTGDSDSGISAANTYTHAINFGRPGSVTINGVNFSAGTSGDNTATLGYDLEPVGSLGLFTDVIGLFSNNLTGDINKLAEDFYYTSGNSETLKLTGLTSGMTYQTTFYSVGLEDGTRSAMITDGQGGSIDYDQDIAGKGNGDLLRDTYTATSDSITFTFSMDAANDSFEQYGFSNQVVTPEPATLGLLGLGAMGLLRRRKPMKSSMS